VLVNYITNALKYSADEKPITVCLEVMEGRAVVSVRDGGPGLPLDEQVGIWEMFHRVPGVTAQDSTERINASMGLGLHICKRLIELHHGQVGVESAVGQGSTFWFALPLASDLA
jgi:signal transduction histidine kinase